MQSGFSFGGRGLEGREDPHGPWVASQTREGSVPVRPSELLPESRLQGPDGGRPAGAPC